MLSCPLKLSASRLAINSMPRTLLRLDNFDCVIDHTKYPAFRKPLVKNISLCNRSVKSCLSEKRILIEKTQFDKDTPGNFEYEEDKESGRRKKIGHANKGKVPWNKGRKHSEETRERIRQRTKEALQDPKIRKKMSECPRTLSNQTKVRIRASLTKLWGERLKWKRSRERFWRSWGETIAEAARLGASDQQELDWDSYDKIKKELALEHLRQAEEKAKIKEKARIEAEKSARTKAEKMAKLAQRRKEREEKSKVEGESIKRRNRKSKEEKSKLVEFQEVKLKERLMKIHKRKSALNQVSNQQQRSWEKIDMELVKGEQLRKEMSLADQIRSAKNRRAEQLLGKL